MADPSTPSSGSGSNGSNGGQAGRPPRDPFRSLLRLSRSGDITRYRGGSEPAFLVNHPDLIRRVLAENCDNYSKDTFVNSMFREAVADGLLTSEGPEWRHQRRLMQPAFHRDRLVKLAEGMTEITVAMLARWEDLAEGGEELDVATEMGSMTLRITSRALFGVDVTDEADSIGHQIAASLRAIVSPQKAHFQEGRKNVGELVARIVEERRAMQTDSVDLVRLLVEARDEETGEGLTPDQLHNQIITLLLAGHETTANSLAWTWYLLARNPDVLHKVRTETASALEGRVPGVHDLPKMPYTRMVLEESMRLYPPAWIMGRRALAEDRLGDQAIPAGSVVAICPYTVHRHPSFWTDPERFEPLRFSAERTANRHAYSYIPFGAGPRLCIGHNLAMIEAQLIIGTVVQRYDLRLPPGHVVEPERLFVLRPRGGLPMTVHRV